MAFRVAGVGGEPDDCGRDWFRALPGRGRWFGYGRCGGWGVRPPVSDAPTLDDGQPGHHDVLTGELPTPETPGTAQPPPAEDVPGTRKEPL